MRSLVTITLETGRLGFVATPENLCRLIRYLAPVLEGREQWSALAVREGISDNYALREGP